MILKRIYIITLLLFCFTGAKSQQLHHLSRNQLIERQWIDLNHASKFSYIQVQDHQGRMKPIQTLALELLRKVYGKDYFQYLDNNGQKQKLTPTQVFLGMQLKPDSWQLLECIKIEKKAIPSLKNSLTINSKGYTSPSQFFDFKGQYALKDQVKKAFSKPVGKRTSFDKDIIKIDERINIVWAIFNGQYLKIFPNKKDKNQKWYAPSDDIVFLEEDQLLFSKIIPTYLSQLENKEWKKADETVALIHQFQQTHGADVMKSERDVRWEVWFNKSKIFFWCLIGYTLIGIPLLILGFIAVFQEKNLIVSRLTILFYILIGIVFLTHFFGIICRWYISGHAPWSNGYEATIFIAWICVLAGFLFSTKNPLVLSCACIISICLLGIAHGSLMNPEITNLVPVLKSYWLLIHVAIITASYGFLSLGSILSLIALLIMCINTFKRLPLINAKIQEITNINQLISTIGLYMLTIGTFLGGIWANESWGRYWGWDPKETWALISIIVYSFVLHIRIIFKHSFVYIYNVINFFAISSLIMTFFGVNYYLSGLHSYAKGDSFPIPSWIYIAITVGIIISLIPKVVPRFISKKTTIKKPIFASQN